MLKINSSFNLKIIFNLFLIINFILTIGFLNSSWLGLFAWMILFMCIYSGVYLLIKEMDDNNLYNPIFHYYKKFYKALLYILEGSNVFIGGRF